MPNGNVMPDENSACDATHRGRISDTHPTHACSEEIRRFSSVRIARSAVPSPQNGGFPLFAERARHALGGLPC